MTSESSSPPDDDTVDVHEVAKLLGLKHRTSVGTYLWRYPDMPKPVAPAGGRGHGARWSRSQLLAWLAENKNRYRRRRPVP